MWNNLKTLADAGATVGGIIFLWYVALGFAEQKVRTEYEQDDKKRYELYDLDDVTFISKGGKIKIKIKK